MKRDRAPIHLYLARVATFAVATAFGAPASAGFVSTDVATPIGSSLDGPRAVAAADIDGDGDLDLFSAEEMLGRISWHENVSGDGSSWTTRTIASFTPGVRDVCVGDFDGDARIDAVYALPNGNPTNNIIFIENALDGIGGLATRNLSNPGEVPGASGVAAGDLDGDGDLDVASCGTGGEVRFHENDGTPLSGPWPSTTLPSSGGVPHDIDIGDVDGDGDLDVIVAQNGADQIVWYENEDGIGTSWTERVALGGLDEVFAIRAADLDEDGDLDIVYGNQGDHFVGWIENDGFDPPGFSQNIFFAASNDPWQVIVGDFNHDTKLDVMTAIAPVSGTTGEVQVSYNDGGTFFVSTSISASTNIRGVRGITAGDFDGDGDLDAVGASFEDDLYHLHVNDRIHHTAVFGPYQTIELGLSAAQSIHSADLNLDGETDVLASLYGDGELAWYESDGTPFGGTWTKHLIASGLLNPRRAIVGDIDSDGDQDVIVGEDHPAGHLYVYESDGAVPPNFTQRDLGFTNTNSLAVGDVNEDGRIDIVSSGGSAVSWHENPDSLTAPWTRTTITNLTAPRGVKVVDINQDGRPDVLVASFVDNVIRAAIHNGFNTPSFTTQDRVDPAIDGPQRIAIGDVDGDGDPDVVFGGTGSHETGWLENDGGAFSAFPIHLLSGVDGATAISLADLDLDGDLDFATSVANVDTGGSQFTRVYWHENDGGSPPAFASTVVQERLADSTSTFEVAAMDLDSDGRADLVSGWNSTYGIEAYQNLGGQFSFHSRMHAMTEIEEGSSVALIRSVLRHNGNPGDDDMVFTGVSWTHGSEPEVSLPDLTGLITGTGYLLDDGSGQFEPGQETSFESFRIGGGGSISDTYFTDEGARTVAAGDSAIWWQAVSIDDVAFTADPNAFYTWVRGAGGVPGNYLALGSLFLEKLQTDTTYHEIKAPAIAEMGDVTPAAIFDSQVGRGMAWIDYDNDEDLDLFVANRTSGQNRLFENETVSPDSAIFVDATGNLPVVAGESHGVTMGDYDNDGLTDLYVSEFATAPNQLLENNGSGFTDVADATTGSSSVSLVAKWVDFDLDGHLDLHVTGWVANDRLLQNDGLGGFVDVTPPQLLDSGAAASASWGDYDNDGDQDLYLSKDNAANRLIRNDGGGTFVDVTPGLLADAGDGRGAAWGDYDNDGDLDLYLANRNSANRLFRNDNNGTFADVASGDLADAGPSSSVTWGDIDNDGDLDLYLTSNGAPNRLFRNHGDGTFGDIATGDLADPGSNITTMLGDYDGDGDLDLYQVNEGTNRLLNNDEDSGNHWIHMRLEGTFSNRSAIGARVRIVAGGQQQIREVGSDAGNQGENSLTVEFGLGEISTVDSIQIRWPSGIFEDTTNVVADQVLDFLEGMTLVAVGDDPAGPGRIQLYDAYPNPSAGASTIRFDLPRPSPVSIRIYNVAGRLVRELVPSGTSFPGGRHSRIWDARTDDGARAPSGIYFYEFAAAGHRDVRRIVLLGP